ncbi:hypothetical protein [Sulfurimonas sp.]
MNYKSKIETYLPFVLIFLLLYYNLTLYFTHSFDMNLLYNSDSAYLPSLYKDLIIDSGKYINWYGSPAPYYFPDMFLYFISNFFFSFYYAIAFYFTIISLLVIYGTYKINLELFPAKKAIVLTLYSFSILTLIQSSASQYLFMSVFHYGEFSIGLFTLYLALKIIKEKIIIYYLILMLMLMTLTIASDKLFIIQFIIPTALATLVLWLNNTITVKKFLIISFIIGLSLLLSHLLAHITTMHTTTYNISLTIKAIPKNILNIASLIKNEYTHYKIYFILILTIYLISIGSLLLNKKVQLLQLKNRESITIIFFTYYLVFLLITNLTIFLFYPLPLTTRYFIPLYTIPVLIGLPVLIKWFKININNNILKIINLFLLIILLIFLTYTSIKHRDFKNEYYPKSIECIDSFSKMTGAKSGVSGYWESKSFNLLSKENITIAQVHKNLTPYLHVTTLDYYKDKYDFALIKDNNIDENLILSINGKPDKIFNCDDMKILYYKKGLYTKKFYKLYSKEKWYAASLPSQTGSINKNNTITANEKKDAAGYITYGPYITLNAGKYSVEISYISNKPQNILIGKFDVNTIHSNKSKVIKEGKIFGTLNKNNTIHFEFILSKKIADLSTVEIRNYYNGIGNMTINYILVTRIQ